LAPQTKRSELGAYDRALLILAGRPHSSAELRRKLRQRGHDADEVEATLTRLGEAGYLDDRAFAQSLVGWRSGKRGRRAMASELAARGVSRDVAMDVLGELDPAAELEAARRLVARDSDDPRRAAARLRRRGFGEDTIRSALRELGPLDFTSAG
jgi:regulatory protein